MVDKSREEEERTHKYVEEESRQKRNKKELRAWERERRGNKNKIEGEKKGWIQRKKSSGREREREIHPESGKVGARSHTIEKVKNTSKQARFVLMITIIVSGMAMSMAMATAISVRLDGL